jgi:phage terminase large subunit-like protein
MANSERLAWLLSLPSQERFAHLARFSGAQRSELAHHWRLWAREEQLAPGGEWRTWLVMAGRGFGKTRLGSEWVREIAGDFSSARIALVGATLAEARSVMVEGESGILACCPPHRRPRYEPSLRRLTWSTGAQATLYSAAEPDSLRGPQHSHAWCDEIAKWDNSGGRAEDSWNNLVLGLRLGESPRALATTTPRAVPLLQRLLDEEDVAVTRGRTQDNAYNLPSRFMSDMRRSFGRSALARQELDGELLTDIEGALWTRGLIEAARESVASSEPVRTVIGVDPPASAGGDACGIVVVQLGADGVARVREDATILRASPEKWARAVADTAARWRPDRVVAEANQGGAMVESVLRAAELTLPIRLVHASVGKVARAEPVAALYEVGRVRHVGAFPALEDQLCGLIAGGGYQGPGRSPDRADALVWALHEVMLSVRAAPRVIEF